MKRFSKLKSVFFRTPESNIVIGEIIIEPDGKALIKVKKSRSDTYELVLVTDFIVLLLQCVALKRSLEVSPNKGGTPNIKENNDDSHPS